MRNLFKRVEIQVVNGATNTNIQHCNRVADMEAQLIVKSVGALIFKQSQMGVQQVLKVIKFSL